MLKITIQVQEDKDKKCMVKMINSKNLSKSTEIEKRGYVMVINQITKALQEIQD